MQARTLCIIGAALVGCGGNADLKPLMDLRCDGAVRELRIGEVGPLVGLSGEEVLSQAVWPDAQVVWHAVSDAPALRQEIESSVQQLSFSVAHHAGFDVMEIEPVAQASYCPSQDPFLVIPVDVTVADPAAQFVARGTVPLYATGTAPDEVFISTYGAGVDLPSMEGVEVVEPSSWLDRLEEEVPLRSASIELMLHIDEAGGHLEMQANGKARQGQSVRLPVHLASGTWGTPP